MFLTVGMAQFLHTYLYTIDESINSDFYRIILPILHKIYHDGKSERFVEVSMDVKFDRKIAQLSFKTVNLTWKSKPAALLPIANKAPER